VECSLGLCWEFVFCVSFAIIFSCVVVSFIVLLCFFAGGG
jgi:hypothetical protein